MQCLLCHKKISRLRVWKTKSEFCSDEHADTYKKQTLERLLRDQEQLLHKVSAPPLPIGDNPADDGLDAILGGGIESLAGGIESEGIDRSHLLSAPAPSNTTLDAVGDELSFTPAESLPAAESLNDILAPNKAAGTSEDIRQQSPDEALEALRRLSEHSAAQPPHIASDAASAPGAAEDELLGPLERLAASRNVDAQELLDEVVSGSDVLPESDRENTGAGIEFGPSETVEKGQESGGTSSMLDRLMEAGPASEPSQALQMPAVGERLGLDGTPSADESGDGESAERRIGSAAKADAAESAATQSEADAPSESSIPLWLKEFDAETSGLEDLVAREPSGQESHEVDPDQVRFPEAEASEEPLENPDSASLALGSEEESDHEIQADGGAKDTPKSAGWMSALLQGGAPEVAHPDSEGKTPELGIQTHPERDAKLPENAAPETTQPAYELEPGDLDLDRAAAAEESSATTGEDQEMLDSPLDGLMTAPEDGGESHEVDSVRASGQTDADPPMRNVVPFPGPDELQEFKAASSQEPTENEPEEDGAQASGAQSSLDAQQQWTPWLEMMDIELSAQELAESDAPEQDPEAAGVTVSQGAPWFSPSVIAMRSHAGLSIWDAISAPNVSACEEIDPPSDSYGLDTNPAQTQTSVGVHLGDGALGAVRRADRIPQSEEMIPFTLRPSGNVREGFLGHLADLLPAGMGKYVSLPLDGLQATFTPRLAPLMKSMTLADSPRLGSEVPEFALDQSGSTMLPIVGTAVCRARPELQPLSPSARLTLAEGLRAVAPRMSESVGKGLLHQQAEVAVPILELQSPNRIAARTPLKPIASSACLEIFEGLWLPAPQLLDLADQTADRMCGDLIRTKVECRLSSLADIRYGLVVNDCHMPPNRLLRCFWPAWTNLPQEPLVYEEVQDSSIEPCLEPRMPAAIYHHVRAGRTTFPRVKMLLMATGANERVMSAMAWQPDGGLYDVRADLAYSDMPLSDFGGEVRDWRAEPIGPLLALHAPNNLDPCEYA